MPPTSLPMRGSLRTELTRMHAAHRAEADLRESPQEVVHAADWLRSADALLIGAGAGLGAHAGFPTFEGPEALRDFAGFPLEEVYCANCFLEAQDDSEDTCLKDPYLAWALWGTLQRRYSNPPDDALKPYKQVLNYATRAPLGAFCISTAVDGAWLQKGLEWPETALLELHGRTGFLQCSVGCTKKVWPAEEDLYEKLEIPEPPNEKQLQALAAAGELRYPALYRARGSLPVCPDCGAPARPAVRLLGDDPIFANVAQDLKAKQVKVLKDWCTELKDRPHSSCIRILCMEIGCGTSVADVRDELMQVMRSFRSARYIRINPDEETRLFGTAPDLRNRCLSLQLGADEALAYMYKHIRAKAADMCRFLVRDRVGICRDAFAPSCVSPLRLLHILERSGVCMQYEIAEKDPEPNVVVFLPSETEGFSPLTGPLPDRAFCRPTEKMQEMEKGIKETLASFSLSHVKFKNGLHSDLVKREIRWCNGLLAALVAAFTARDYQQEVRQQTDRKGLAALVKSVQEAVLPKHGLAAEDYEWRTIQWKLWFYGLLDDSNVRLANEVMLASQVRICGLLPWKKAKPKEQPKVELVDEEEEEEEEEEEQEEDHEEEQDVVQETQQDDEEEPVSIEEEEEVEIIEPEEETQQRKAAEEAARQAEEAERRRAAEEAARKKAAEEAARRRAAEEAARRKAEESARRKAAVEESARRKAAEEAARRKAAEEARRKAAEEAARRQAAEEAARRKAAEEAAQQAEEVARRKAAEEAARQAEEAARQAEERRRAAEEAARQAEELARKKAAEEAARQDQEARRVAEAARAREEKRIEEIVEAKPVPAQAKRKTNHREESRHSRRKASSMAPPPVPSRAKAKASRKRKAEPKSPPPRRALEPDSPSPGKKPGFVRGARVRILSNNDNRGETGILGQYDMDKDLWEVTGEFGTEWFDSDSLAFFVAKRPGQVYLEDED